MSDEYANTGLKGSLVNKCNTNQALCASFRTDIEP